MRAAGKPAGGIRLMRSLHGRLLLAASIVLTAFISITGFSLDRAFRQSAETALRDRLQGHIYALLAASEVSPDGRVRIARSLADPRFSTPGSGLYAQVTSATEGELWQSGSHLGQQLAYADDLAAGERRYTSITTDDGSALLELSFAIVWEGTTGTSHALTYHVAEHLKPLREQISSFRRTLWGWLTALAALLLGVQGLVVRWGLRPLRRVADDLSAIEAGKHQRLEGEYPRELASLTGNINALLRHERAQLERYRNTLGDLAHSLKTPLAVLGGLSDVPDISVEERGTLRDQVARMREIVDYQLQKAAMAGRSPLAAPLAVDEVVEKIVASLRKVYADKQLQISSTIDPQTRFRGELGDLMELAGNLLDNACKWGRHEVSIVAYPLSAKGGLCMSVEDDGPGIAELRANEILQRGVRADTHVPGHGIGLAMVRDIVEAYGGHITIGTAALGGARMVIELPA
ncbi:MAG: histidine kinase [Proteobacteria bacterium]|nr:MAG: histidine kinase [Pseudomonadota bacterium]